MKRAQWRMVLWASLVVAGNVAAWGGTGEVTILDRQGSWETVQENNGNAATLFLAKADGSGRTPLARVEIPSVTVTNVYWDAFAGRDAQTGEAVGGMVTNVDTIAGEFAFRLQRSGERDGSRQRDEHRRWGFSRLQRVESPLRA